MYDVNDTIVAVSSPTSQARVIVRITGPDTMKVCRQIFHPQAVLEAATQQRNVVAAGNVCAHAEAPRGGGTLLNGQVAVDAELSVDAQLYLFFAPHSYTADHVAEIHICANSSVTEGLMTNLLGKGLRAAGPGEFTARAYLNGKIDLAQAEAVNEIVVSSNTFQLAAAEKLLSGRLAETTDKVRSDMIDCLSLIEAGLDFSGEDIEFMSRREAAERLTAIRGALEQLLSSSIRYESVVDLPAVGIAGAPNAGKSSLANKLLGADRSIVSSERRTTRDVLTGLLTLDHCRCVLFDCAGLIRGPSPPRRKSILDELAHEAAIEALRNSSVVVFCVDISKADWSEDVSIYGFIEPRILIPVATKSDLLFRHGRTTLARRLNELNGLFARTGGDASVRMHPAIEFLATSVKTGSGVGLLRETIDRKIIELALGATTESVGHGAFLETAGNGMALMARHRQAVTEAIQNISESINELEAGNDEVAAMILRAAYQSISCIESADRRIDEQVLEKIFSRFCIGK